MEPWRKWGRNPVLGAMGFYSYFVDYEARSRRPHWGDAFRPDDPAVLIERGRWYCMEMMIKANSPDHADGEQAFWIDGKFKGYYTDICWQTTEKLKINYLWFLL